MLRVTDLDRSIKWYTEALGCNLIRTRDNPDNGYKLAFLGKFSCFARHLTLDIPAQGGGPTSGDYVKLCLTTIAHGTFVLASALHLLYSGHARHRHGCGMLVAYNIKLTESYCDKSI